MEWSGWTQGRWRGGGEGTEAGRRGEAGRGEARRRQEGGAQAGGEEEEEEWIRNSVVAGRLGLAQHKWSTVQCPAGGFKREGSKEETVLKASRQTQGKEASERAALGALQGGEKEKKEGPGRAGLAAAAAPSLRPGLFLKAKAPRRGELMSRAEMS